MRNTADLRDWQACERPGRKSLSGKYATCEPYSQDAHSAGLFEAIGGEHNADLWTFMPFGPFTSKTAMEEVLAYVNPAEPIESSWQTMVIRAAVSGEILGMASYMRIREAHGSAEVGAVTFSHKLQRTPIATDAMYLMARHVFDGLGYRRYEWKCDNENDASKRAAIRFGYQFEGIFRNDMVVKGKNRDTAWYAVTDTDWPKIQAGFKAWLSPENFDGKGRQQKTLQALREA